MMLEPCWSRATIVIIAHASNLSVTGICYGFPLSQVMLLDDALEYVTGDELVEITPLSCRIRKLPKAQKFR